MASLAEPLRSGTRLDGPRQTHLQRLVASWGPLADLCFADLLLFVPVASRPDHFVVVAQVRPTTNQTVYRQDFVGEHVDGADRPLMVQSIETGEVVEGESERPMLNDRVHVLCIPVRYQGEIIAVMSRESAPNLGRQPGELERTYFDVFARFARMIAAGTFPFAADDVEGEESPRVGDGA